MARVTITVDDYLLETEGRQAIVPDGESKTILSLPGLFFDDGKPRKRGAHLSPEGKAAIDKIIKSMGRAGRPLIDFLTANDHPGADEDGPAEPEEEPVAQAHESSSAPTAAPQAAYPSH